MSGVELRWALPEHTTAAPPRLEYRVRGEWPAAPGPWVEVPTVVVPQESPKPAPTALIAFGVTLVDGETFSRQTPMDPAKP